MLLKISAFSYSQLSMSLVFVHFLKMLTKC